MFSISHENHEKSFRYFFWPNVDKLRMALLNFGSESDEMVNTRI